MKVGNIMKNNQMMQYSCFEERMRPRNFDELLIAEETISAFNKMMSTDNVMNMIFHSSPGAGKTTCANLFLNADKFDCYRLNAASDNLRKLKIENFASASSLFLQRKLVLIDEADLMAPSVQESLRESIDQHADTCRFILITNRLSSIQPQLKSRCKTITFDVQISMIDSMKAKLFKTIKHRLAEINQDIDDSKLNKIVSMNFPDFRAVANDIEFELFA
jgi:replication-associated recombination protein RarA